MSNFTENLNDGDLVVVCVSGAMTRDSIAKVVRLTKTQIILESGDKFRKSDGYKVGENGNWNRSYLREATKETVEIIREKQERRELIGKIKKLDWNKLATEDLRNTYNNVIAGDK